MNSIILFLLFIPILAGLLLSISFAMAPHKAQKEKKTPFECGYHSFLSQSRFPFSIIFFIFGLLYLVFAIEVLLIYPYAISSEVNNTFGLCIVVSFIVVITTGFIFEIGKGALKVDTKLDQYINSSNNKTIA